MGRLETLKPASGKDPILLIDSWDWLAVVQMIVAAVIGSFLIVVAWTAEWHEPCPPVARCRGLSLFALFPYPLQGIFFNFLGWLCIVMGTGKFFKKCRRTLKVAVFKDRIEFYTYHASVVMVNRNIQVSLYEWEFPVYRMDLRILWRENTTSGIMVFYDQVENDVFRVSEEDLGGHRWKKLKDAISKLGLISSNVQPLDIIEVRADRAFGRFNF